MPVRPTRERPSPGPPGAGAPVLLTATITPSAVPGLVVTDPRVRRVQYLDAFEFYLRQGLGRPLVLAENSGADLADFRRLAQDLGREDDVRLVPVAPRPGGADRGRGLAELHLVADAVDQLPELGDRMIWKVTGRYRVSNLLPLVGAAGTWDLCLNFRRWPQPWCDLWVYGATRRGVHHLLSHEESFREDLDGRPAEARVGELLTELRVPGLDLTPRLPREPRLHGTRGFDGRSYESPAQRAKYLIRVVARRVVPALWI